LTVADGEVRIGKRLILLLRGEKRGRVEERAGETKETIFLEMSKELERRKEQRSRKELSIGD
jgi:hypothetical protein